MERNLRWAFICVPDPAHRGGMFAYLNFRRAAGADFAVAGRHYGVFAHDWGAEPVQAWLDALAQRELGEGFTPEWPAPQSSSELVVLAQPAFKEAVRQALRDYTRPDALACNPLLRSRLLVERSGRAAGPADLQAVLREGIQALNASPRDAKLYRALELTYLKPAPSQEAAAEQLNLPFSTYRYHLSRGVERLVDWLWQRELHGPEGPTAIA